MRSRYPRRVLGAPELVVLVVVVLVLFGLARLQRLLEQRVDETALGRRTFETICRTATVRRIEQGEVPAILARFAKARSLRVGPYTAHVPDEPGVNAMALPGGIVLITQGLLALRTRGDLSVDELAAVLAHEVGHIELGHSRRREVQATMSSWATRLGPTPGGLVGRIAMGAGLSALQKRASRDAEKEADAWAVGMLRAAGYDTGGLATFLRRIAGWSRSAGLWSTHPSPEERIEALSASA